MNKRHYMKISLLLVLGFYVFAGCSTPSNKAYTAEERNNLAKIEIYSAENNELIKTIKDEKTLPRSASQLIDQKGLRALFPESSVLLFCFHLCSAANTLLFP